MLEQIKVNNYALIDNLSLSLTPGLNVLSGETGGGKSIIIGAISLLLGERSSAEQVRQGEETAQVEGFFTFSSCSSGLTESLEEAVLEYEGELIISREVYRGGRSVGRVQGRAVPAAFLKELGQHMVDLHGQHQHQSLLQPGRHLDLLDNYAGGEVETRRKKVEELYTRRQKLHGELSRLGFDAAERERRMDILDFQIKEIREAELNPLEEEELAKRERILSNAEKLSAIVNRVYAGIYGDEQETAAALDIISSACSHLEEGTGLDERLKPLVEILENTSLQLREVSLQLRDYLTGLEFDPGELVAVQERLNLIRALKRKYGGGVEEVVQFACEAEEELERIGNSEKVARDLEEEIKDLEKELLEESRALRSLRKEAGSAMEKLVENSLKDLALPGARFIVSIAEKEELSPKGMDQVEFLFSANPGEDLKPMAKIISGGETSRVMLALKSILANQDSIPTLIFDEVDAGIGGVTIQSVAEKLALLARNHQVICVTHSPQIAAMADNHILLYKEQSGERTYTRGKALNKEERRKELARMLDGASIDQVSLRHVDSLLERSLDYKKQIAVS